MYLDRSQFLADINCERDDKNATYKENLSTLERLILVLFDADETVVPKESAVSCSFTFLHSELLIQ